MYQIDEIAPDLYRISIFVPAIQMQFNHFLIKDDEPLLYHAGLKQMFPVLLDAVKTLLDPGSLRWIGFSHFEVDECGALNDWLQIAPNAQAVCSECCAMVNLSDFAIRPAFAMKSNDTLKTGKRTYRYIRTPHLPHGWDAGVMFEESEKTLLCSDLFHQNGDLVALTDKDILEAHKSTLLNFQKTFLMDYTPYNHKTKAMLFELADLKPRTMATMHGSSFTGNCSRALMELDGVMKEVWGEK
jgi:flavorubredoxin